LSLNHDLFVPELVTELRLEGDVNLIPTRTGKYFNGRMWKHSTPLDLLRFKALSMVDRIRLGLLVFQERRIKDWKPIEH
ncbi:amine oxidase, partial [Pseudomonas syringae pv. tagetis]